MGREVQSCAGNLVVPVLSAIRPNCLGLNVNDNSTLESSPDSLYWQYFSSWTFYIFLRSSETGNVFG